MQSMEHVEMDYEETGSSDDYALFVYQDDDGVLMAEYIVPPQLFAGELGGPVFKHKAVIYRWQVDDDPIEDLNLSDEDIDELSSYLGMTPEEFITSAPVEIYQTYGSYHGYMNLDGDPLSVTLLELRDRWPSTFSDIDPDSEIYSALGKTILDASNLEAAAILSQQDEMEMLDLERDGYDADTYIRVAEFGDSTGVNGEVVPWKVAEARMEGLERLAGGGAWPGGQGVELDAVNVITATARELDAPANWVEEVFRDVFADELKAGRNEDLLYWESDSGRIFSYASRL